MSADLASSFPAGDAPSAVHSWFERDRSERRQGRAGTREASTLTVSQTTLPTTYPLEVPMPGTADGAHTDSDEPGPPQPLQAGAPVREDSPTFAELGIRDEIVRTLRAVGIERAFAIQELTLPLALAGDDLIGQARTGTGKTLGFGVPLLQRITSGDTALDGTPRALVVVPTRELCLQVSADLSAAGRALGIRVLPVYGGRPYEPQIKALSHGIDVVVGTPGRLLDLAEQRCLVLGKVRVLVLDEADEMLDLGFLPDIERIMQMVPEQRQTMLFSATMPGPIIKLARTFLNRPTHIRAEEPDATAIHERTRQFVYRAHAMDKIELLARILQARDRGLTMIFARTKRTAQKVAEELTERGFAAAAVHGDLGQSAREQALRAFRSEKVDVLVATDVAARGLDVPEVTHVINYQCPEDEKTYVHRSGRTGRAGRTGVAITLVDWDEEPRWKLISDALDLGIPDPAETYSTSAHLFTDLDIPDDSTGLLPIDQQTRAGLAAEPTDGGVRRRGRRGPVAHRDTQDASADGSLPPVRRLRRRTRRGQVVETTTQTMPPAAEHGNDHGDARTRRRRRRNRVRGTDTTGVGGAVTGHEHGDRPRAAG
ncbi:MAG: DEAD/DEAH box helicase [Pseudonocardiales bacterium]|nr:DEAD/DEAH box helicase [Pseudonocardiales bacterium]MBV9652585.1 DEAD/DEAH box helicase [Pseudonocardiales bacterium]